MKKSPVDEQLALVQNTLEQWLSFRKYLVKALNDEPVSMEDEANFLEVKSSVARTIRAVGERIKDLGKFDFGGQIVRDLLGKCVSVDHMRGLPVNDRRALFKDWHGAFVRLSRTVGALKFMSEGYVPGSGQPGPKKGAAAVGGSKKKVKGIVVALLVLGGGAAAYFFLFA